MHEYDNGRHGLAAFCDTCGEQITEHGFVIWNCDNVADWRVIHQARCEPPRTDGYDCSMGLDEELVYLANSAGVDLNAARKSVSVLEMLA